MRTLIPLVVLGVVLGLSGCAGAGGNDAASTSKPVPSAKANNASTPQSGEQPKESPKPPTSAKSGSS